MNAELYQVCAVLIRRVSTPEVPIDV